jgi:hypothetical protein
MTTKAPARGPHRTDVLSLVFGLLFLGCAGAWAAEHFLDLPWRIDWRLPHLGWIVAGGLVLAGLLGILASLRRQDEPEPTPTTPAEAPLGAREGEDPE